MEAEHLNGQASNVETMSAAEAKTTAREQTTTTWRSLSKKKLIAVATVGTALVAGVFYVAQWYSQQKE